MYFLPDAACAATASMQCFYRSNLIFRKDIGITASVETLIYEIDSRHLIIAAQYSHSDKSLTQIISIRLIIKCKPDFHAPGKIASISVLHQT